MKLHLVPARTGLEWVKLGVRAFRQQPMALALLFFTAFLGMSLLAQVPFIGSALSLALLPATSLAMMVAAADAVAGRQPTPALLLVAFRTGRQRMRDLLLLGAIYTVGFLSILALTAAIDGGQFAQMYLGMIPFTEEMAQHPAFQAAMWVAVLLYLPLSLMFWHAPGLVHWHGVPAVKALFFSIVACARNMGAFLVFGLAWMGVSIGVGLVVSIVAGLLAIAGLGVMAASGVMVGAAMVLATMLMTSVVFTFRDCFDPPEHRWKEPSHDNAPQPPAAGADRD